MHICKKNVLFCKIYYIKTSYFAKFSCAKRLILQIFRAQNVLFCKIYYIKTSYFANFSSAKRLILQLYSARMRSTIVNNYHQLSKIANEYFYIIKNTQPCRSAMPVAMRESPQNGSFEYYSTLHSSPPLLSVKRLPGCLQKHASLQNLGRYDAPRCLSRSKAKVNCFLHAYNKSFRCATLSKT